MAHTPTFTLLLPPRILMGTTVSLTGACIVRGLTFRACHPIQEATLHPLAIRSELTTVYPEAIHSLSMSLSLSMASQIEVGMSLHTKHTGYQTTKHKHRVFNISPSATYAQQLDSTDTGHRAGTYGFHLQLFVHLCQGHKLCYVPCQTRY